jgi:hypothetical protein
MMTTSRLSVADYRNFFRIAPSQVSVDGQRGGAGYAAGTAAPVLGQWAANVAMYRCLVRVVSYSLIESDKRSTPNNRYRVNPKSEHCSFKYAHVNVHAHVHVHVHVHAL